MHASDRMVTSSDQSERVPGYTQTGGSRVARFMKRRHLAGQAASQQRTRACIAFKSKLISIWGPPSSHSFHFPFPLDSSPREKGSWM